MIRLSVPGLSLISIALLTASAPAAEPITGRASVTDGDTVVIHGTRIYLYGIDAPESVQICQDASEKDYRCGQQAALALADRIGEAPITCEPRDTDRYGRTVAICRKGDEDLNAWMVSEGHAVAFRRFTTDYVKQEEQARAARRGIWAGTFTEPSEYRRTARGGHGETRPGMEMPRATTEAMTCAIKGNINGKGEHIYHVPESRDYAGVVIDEKAGERMFCSEVEAQAAGWRASQR